MNIRVCTSVGFLFLVNGASAGLQASSNGGHGYPPKIGDAHERPESDPLNTHTSISERFEALRAEMNTTPTDKMLELLRENAGDSVLRASIDWLSVACVMWAETDPKEFAVFIESRKPKCSWKMRKILYRTWSRNAPSDMFAFLDKQGSTEIEDLIEDLLNAVAYEPETLHQIEKREEQWELDTESRNQLRHLQLVSEIRRDAANVFSDIAKGRSREVQRTYLPIAVVEITEENPAEAIRLIEQAPLTLRSQLKRTVINNWLYKDAESATIAAKSIGKPYGDEVLRLPLEMWAREEPLEAITWVKENFEGFTRRQIIAQIAQAIAYRNPEQAVLLLEQIPRGKARRETASRIAGAWAKQDIDATLTWIESIDDPLDRIISLSEALDVLASSDAQRAVLLVEQFQNEHASISGEIDQAIDGIVYDAIEKMSIQNPYEALQLAYRIPETYTRRKMLRKIYNRWVNIDPDAAASSFLEDYRKNRIEENVASVMAYDWARYAPYEALQWAKSDAPDTRQTVAAVYLSWARTDPESLKDSKIRHDLPLVEPYFINFIKALANHDPVFAGSQLRSLKRQHSTENDLIAEAFGEVAEIWFLAETPTALEWVNSLPAGIEKDSALTAIIQVARNRDPNLALQLTRSYSNKEVRIYSAKSIVRHFASLNREVALKALEEADFPTQEENAIRASLRE